MKGQYGRKIFFWALAILFVLTTALVVFYAFGYRFSFERGVFVYGGSVTVKSNPRTVNIFLNDQPVSQNKINFINGSYHIDGIRPGDYKLSAEAPDFQRWTKNISVHSGVSTEFWNVLLARDDYSETDHKITTDERFFISPDGDRIAYTWENGDNFSVNVLDVKKNESLNIFSSPEFNFTKNDKENIEWSPRSDAVIIPAVRLSDSLENYFIVNIENKNVINLKDLAQNENLTGVRWDPQRKNIVYFISQNNLFSIDIANPGDMKKMAENATSFDFAENYLYYFQLPGGAVHRLALNGAGSPEQITFSPPEDMENPNYKLVVYDESRIALINYENGKLFVWNSGAKDKYFRKLSADVRGLQFSDDGKKLLFWNGWEIFVYFTRDWDVQPVRAENEILEVARYSQEIKNVQWSKDYEHVIFTVEGKIKIAELDRRDRCNNFNIAELESNEGSVVNFPADEKIYFTGKNQNNNFFNLFSIDFPEKEGILGL